MYLIILLIHFYIFYFYFFFNFFLNFFFRLSTLHSALRTPHSAFLEQRFIFGDTTGLAKVSRVRCRSRPGARFSKAPETFRARKAIAKSRTLRLQRCFIHIFLI